MVIQIDANDSMTWRFLASGWEVLNNAEGRLTLVYARKYRGC